MSKIDAREESDQRGYTRFYRKYTVIIIPFLINQSVIWEYQLPAGGYATPATYQADGKQYVVIAVGGGGNQHTKATDYYIAFTLP